MSSVGQSEEHMYFFSLPPLHYHNHWANNQTSHLTQGAPDAPAGCIRAFMQSFVCLHKHRHLCLRCQRKKMRARLRACFQIMLAYFLCPAVSQERSEAGNHSSAAATACMFHWHISLGGNEPSHARFPAPCGYVWAPRCHSLLAALLKSKSWYKQLGREEHCWCANKKRKKHKNLFLLLFVYLFIGFYTFYYSNYFLLLQGKLNFVSQISSSVKNKVDVKMSFFFLFCHIVSTHNLSHNIWFVHVSLNTKLSLSIIKLSLNLSWSTHFLVIIFYCVDSKFLDSPNLFSQ